MIYTLSALGEKDPVVKGILQHKAPGEMAIAVKRYVLEKMEETGALKRTKDLAIELQDALVEEVKRLEGVFGAENEILEMVLKRLCVA
ncbi:hypothetical protein BJY04DRAFT_119746 [Aspergillus karnatakaensis]|uniref:uncharacterized protein n=1 Tax=Aspergillus karnatakaensis TaxID=1810916 RepID=UPI003CCCEE72